MTEFNGYAGAITWVEFNARGEPIRQGNELGLRPNEPLVSLLLRVPKTNRLVVILVSSEGEVKVLLNKKGMKE